ncbi:glycosyltransferase family 4 protein [Kitasatospora arboriphila]
MSPLGPEHWQVGIPVDGDGSPDPAAMAEHRPAVSWWAACLLALPGARPRIVHVRFADDGSLAVADAARRCGARPAFTVTPDPHRTMAERHAGLPLHAETETARALRADLHRVFVADRLVARAGLLVTIPSRPGTGDLDTHFPQLSPATESRRVEVPEGIPPFVPRPGDAGLADAMTTRLFSGGGRPDGLDPEDRGLRLMLCVGRLHPVKQQDRLVEAWLDTGLYRSTTLLLVGGSPGRATAVEAGVRDAIAKLLAGQPLGRRRIALWPALPNRQVRILERALAEGRAGSAVYVCPSAKEEFGLAVLEAMDAGLAAAGPERGGVPHYIRDGVNGFLLDTGSGTALGAGLLSVCATPQTELDALAARAMRTVRRSYSVEAMAESLARAYTAVP